MKTFHLHRHLILLIFGSLLLLSFACTEKIKLDLGETYTRLVIEGAISSDTMSHIVRLTKTTDFYYDRPAPAVSEAFVSISDGNNTYELKEDSLQPGTYKTTPNAFGVPGKTYTLSVQLKEAINGHTFYQASCEMPEVGPIDSIDIKYRSQWKIWEIGCYAWDPPTVNYYMFNTWKNDIRMTDTINKVLITDDKLYNGSYTNGAAVGYLRAEIPRENINPGDTIKVQIAGITREYLYFIYDVQLESGYKNPLISGPPANIKGNISNGAIGFFAAYSTKYASTVAK